MSKKSDDDSEESPEALPNFSTRPPPGDVHNEQTTIGQLPDSVLESLKEGQKIDDLRVLAAMANREEPSPPSDATATRRVRAFELPEAEDAEAGASRRVSKQADDRPGGAIDVVAAVMASFTVDPPAFPSPPTTGPVESTVIVEPEPTAPEAEAHAGEPPAVAAAPAARRSRPLVVMSVVVVCAALAAAVAWVLKLRPM